MSSDNQITTAPIYPSLPPTAGAARLTMGQSQATHSGFMQGVLPDDATLWSDYYENVMRGDTDQLVSTDPFSKPASMTFDDNNPPDIDHRGVNGAVTSGYAGDPLGGFQGTIGSPGEGNGTNYKMLPELPTSVHRAATGENGSVLSPKKGAESQSTQSNSGTGAHPAYIMGSWSPELT